MSEEEKRKKNNAYKREWYAKRVQENRQKVREEHNRYCRERYQKNIELERKKNLEKYHKNKKSISDLSEEEKQKKREQRRLHQKVFYWRSRGIEIDVNEFKKPSLNAEKIRKTHSMKKAKIPSRINHKYVSEVLRNFPKSKLCNILISKWTNGDLEEFERLEKELNKN